MAFSAENILKILDEGAYHYELPMLDNIYIWAGLLLFSANIGLSVINLISKMILLIMKNMLIQESGEYNDLYEIISSMPYYPIGIDEDGNYC